MSRVWVSLIRSHWQRTGSLVFRSLQDSHYPKQEVRKLSSISYRFFKKNYLGLLKVIVGDDLFTGCLYDMPSWTSLSWVPLLVLESEFNVNN